MVIRQSMYLKQFPLQIREIMGVVNPKFDSNLQQNITISQKFCYLTINLWHLKCKKQLSENSYFLSIHHYGMSKNMQIWIFPNFGPKYPKFHFRSQTHFLLWIWSSNGWLLSEAIHYFWNIMHHGIIGLKLGTKSLVDVVSVNYVYPNMAEGNPKTIFFHRTIDSC